MEVNALGRARSTEALADDRWFLGYYEFIAICLREHVRQRMCRWQAAWNLWQVCLTRLWSIGSTVVAASLCVYPVRSSL